MFRLFSKKPGFILLLILLTINNFGFSFHYEVDDDRYDKYDVDERYDRYGDDDWDEKYERFSYDPDEGTTTETSGGTITEEEPEPEMIEDEEIYDDGDEEEIIEEIKEEIKEEEKVDAEFAPIDSEVAARVESLMKTGDYNLTYFTDYEDAPADMMRKNKRGMVASSDVRCSRVGIYYLKHGGNAIDAAVASTFCLSVIEMASTGLAGGGVSLSYMNGKFKALDFRPKDTETILSTRRIRRSRKIPRRRGNRRNRNRRIPRIPRRKGCVVGKAFKVPGMTMGLYKLWKQGGKLEWKTLLDIPIIIAFKGFEIKPSLSRALNVSKRRLRRDRYLRELFFIGKCIKKTGARVVNKRLARTLHILSKDPKDMYEGKIPTIMTKVVNKDNETEKDIVEEIQKYEPEDLETLDVDIDDKEEMVTTSKTTGGPLLGYLLTATKELKENNPEAFHPDGSVDDSVYLKEFDNMGNAHCLAAHLTNGDTKSIIDELFSKETKGGKYGLPQTRKLLNNECSALSKEEEEYDEEEDIGGSVALNVVDKCGNGVSVQTGINTLFGGKYSFGLLGIIGNPLSLVNNDRISRCRRFTGKLISAYYSPSIVIEKSNRTVTGVYSGAGGRKIPSAVAQVMGNHYYRKLSLAKSISDFRMFAPFRNNKVYSEIEKPIPRRIARMLRSKRQVRIAMIPASWSSSVSGISIKRNKFLYPEEVFGVADFRRNGGVEAE